MVGPLVLGIPGEVRAAFGAGIVELNPLEEALWEDLTRLAEVHG